MKTISKILGVGAGLATASYATYAGITWLRYGRAKRAKGEAADPLLDTFMPAYDVCDRHAIAVAAPFDVTLAAAKDFDLGDSRIVRTIFKARELILRGSRAPDRPHGMYAGMKALGWGILAETEHEVVFGAVTKPWQPDPVFRSLPPGQFAAFAEPDYVKITWTLRADSAPDGGTTFRTETRAIATDPGARAKFRRYWAMLSPGIIVIRLAMLPGVKAASEARWRIVGDDILENPRVQQTHVVHIAAPPVDVWPWLVQMGGGDILPLRPEGSERFDVLRVDPGRSLVLGSSKHHVSATWAFVLEPLGGGGTRLVTRYRAAHEPGVKMSIVNRWETSLHEALERRQLRTIKDHAEHTHVN